MFLSLKWTHLLFLLYVRLDGEHQVSTLTTDSKLDLDLDFG